MEAESREQFGFRAGDISDRAKANRLYGGNLKNGQGVITYRLRDLRRKGEQTGRRGKKEQPCLIYQWPNLRGKIRMLRNLGTEIGHLGKGVDRGIKH